METPAQMNTVGRAPFPGRTGKMAVAANIPGSARSLIVANEDKEEKERERAAFEAARQRLAERIEFYLRRRGVPRRFLHARISDFPQSWGKFKESMEGVFLTGSRGVGKTHLAVAMMREAMLAAGPVKHFDTYRIELQKLPLFVSVPELLLEIRDTYNGHEILEKEIIDKYSWVDVLVLDDLGVEKQKPSEWALRTLYIIIDRRYRENLRTIITSNLGIDEVEERLDDRIASRIAGMCKVRIMQGRDRRVRKS